MTLTLKIFLAILLGTFLAFQGFNPFEQRYWALLSLFMLYGHVKWLEGVNGQEKEFG